MGTVVAILFCGFGENAGAWEHNLLSLMPELEIRIWPEVGDIDDIDVAFVWTPPRGELSRYPNLRAILNLGAGVDSLLSDPTLPVAVPIARIIDPKLTEKMTTYVLMAVLRYHRRLDMFEALQSQAKWIFERPLDNDQRRVGVLGLGELGGDVVRHLARLNFQIAGWSRRPKVIADVECFHGKKELDAFLKRTEILVCLLPSTPGTRGIINAEALRKLPRGARLINVARGDLIVEGDLLSALDSGQVGGATLDVFGTEPLPPDHPFWRHPNVVVTPHIASSVTPRTAAPQVIENIRRAREGEPLIGQVDREAGY